MTEKEYKEYQHKELTKTADLKLKKYMNGNLGSTPKTNLYSCTEKCHPIFNENCPIREDICNILATQFEEAQNDCFSNNEIWIQIIEHYINTVTERFREKSIEKENEYEF